MSIKFRLVKRKNLGKDKEENPQKMYAQPIYSDLVSFEELLGEIGESGIPSNQVKGVADRMNYLIRKHLAAGRRIQFGELGNFRYGVGSSGAATEDEFETSQIKIPRIIFSPGSILRAARKTAKFEKGNLIIPSGEVSKPDEENPDIL
ncbi:DNA-binding protein [Parabacteroides sp. AM08-6]|uniref:HU family DNA-binding protein n=1 Tax=Parabacteroides sp. AM08-6 TaxID=2292053 RepID=UPI00131440BF|nr:DNA-binding protein [Parabacteroides sp. AM08-6]